MKVLILSDSHGDKRRLDQIVSRVPADHVFHCGDFCTDKIELPKGSLTVVRGNCDLAKAPLEEVWEKEGYRFFITHGHKYRVKTTLLNLKYRALEVGANIVCFGHSHIPLCQKVEDILYVNPGSILKPRGFPYPTYVVLKAEENKVNVAFYTIEGKKLNEKEEIYEMLLMDKKNV